jgi:hypothetical protein
MIQREHPAGRGGATPRKIQILKEGGIHYEREDD